MPKITCNDPRTQELNERIFDRNLATGKVDVAYGIPSIAGIEGRVVDAVNHSRSGWCKPFKSKRTVRHS